MIRSIFYLRYENGFDFHIDIMQKEAGLRRAQADLFPLSLTGDKVTLLPDMIDIQFMHGTRTCRVEQLTIAFPVVHVLGAVIDNHRVKLHAFGQVGGNHQRSLFEGRRGFVIKRAEISADSC